VRGKEKKRLDTIKTVFVEEGERTRRAATKSHMSICVARGNICCCCCGCCCCCYVAATV